MIAAHLIVRWKLEMAPEVLDCYIETRSLSSEGKAELFLLSQERRMWEPKCRCIRVFRRYFK
jgi:hypothetical protein